MTETTFTDDDRDGIIATARDYYEGWFDGDAARMQRALHPELSKRSLEPGDQIETISAQDMIDATAEGVGRRSDPDDRIIDIHIDHVHGTIATASVTGAVYVDYLQLVKIAGEWQILNALWAPA